jgi:hypothetical protein
MHPRKAARQEYEIALPGRLDSERNEPDKHPSFFFFFFFGMSIVLSAFPSTFPVFRMQFSVFRIIM